MTQIVQIRNNPFSYSCDLSIIENINNKIYNKCGNGNIFVSIFINMYRHDSGEIVLRLNYGTNVMSSIQLTIPNETVLKRRLYPTEFAFEMVSMTEEPFTERKYNTLLRCLLIKLAPSFSCFVHGRMKRLTTLISRAENPLSAYSLLQIGFRIYDTYLYKPINLDIFVPYIINTQRQQTPLQRQKRQENKDNLLQHLYDIYGYEPPQTLIQRINRRKQYLQSLMKPSQLKYYQQKMQVQQQQQQHQHQMQVQQQQQQLQQDLPKIYLCLDEDMFETSGKIVSKILTRVVTDFTCII
jgi:hypothetical protein